MKGAPKALTPELLERVLERLRAGKRVRIPLQGGGQIHIDRQLPFLLIHRQSGASQGSDRLLRSESSWILAPDSRRDHGNLSALVSGFAEAMIEQFGAFLLVELWPEGPAVEDESEDTVPRFRILEPNGQNLGPLSDRFATLLGRLKVDGQAAHVRHAHRATVTPPSLKPLVHPERIEGLSVIGLEMRPVYGDDTRGGVYPLVFRSFRRQLVRALRRMIFRFIRTRTTQRPSHFHVLGPRALVKRVWEVDRRLCEVASRFDFLYQVTPINSEEAWRAFKRHGFRKEPVFHYRPLAEDPVRLKRELYAIPMERIEDPAVHSLFRQKQDEIDRQVTLLNDLNTPRFVHGSQQLYGRLDDEMVARARKLLSLISPRIREKGAKADASAFAARAETEMEGYRRLAPEFESRIEIRKDFSGIMVSRGRLLIGEDLSLSGSRVEALIQHEVGTHVLTWFNGGRQPMRQLQQGLAGYDELQEGLAVLGEILVGGLSRLRLRTLAARVVAVSDLLAGADFVATFQRLVEQHGFGRKAAFTITMRVFRGGGLTKDAVYLSGLQKLLDYLGRNGNLESLFVGKISLEHLSLVEELRWRGILAPPPLLPSYFDRAETGDRLETLRKGMDVVDLATGSEAE